MVTIMSQAAEKLKIPHAAGTAAAGLRVLGDRPALLTKAGPAGGHA